MDYRRRASRRRLPTLAKVVAGLVLVILATYLGVPLGTPASGDTSAVSTRFTKCRSGSQQDCVVDGDTFRLGSTIIRVEDIDTPETHRARCPQEEALGNRATVRMLELLNAGPFEVVNDGGRDEDRYGRKLRLVMRDGKSLGVILVEEGLAHPWVGHKLPWCS